VGLSTLSNRPPGAYDAQALFSVWANACSRANVISSTALLGLVSMQVLYIPISKRLYFSEHGRAIAALAHWEKRSQIIVV
jgi:hypothetical protein